MNTKKIISFSLGPLGAAFFSFITMPITAWIFSIEDIGRLSIFQVIVTFSTLLFSMGLDQAYVREYHESKDKPALLKVTLLPGFCLLFIAASLLWILPFQWSEMVFSARDPSVSMLLVICLFCSFLSRFLSLTLRMEERAIAYSMSQLTPKVVMLIFVTMYYLSSIKLDFSELASAFTASQVTVLVVLLFNTKKQWLSAIQSKLDKKYLIVILKFGTPLVFGAVAYWGLTALDRFVLRASSTFDELGLYSVSISFASAGVIIQSVFSTIWAPTVYKWAANGLENEKIEKVIDAVLFFVLILFSISGLLSWLVIYVLPEKYNSVQYIVISCIALPLLYALSEATVVGIGLKKKTIFAMMSSFIALVVNIVALYFFVPKYGAAGAAVSTAISFWVFLFLRTEFSARVWYSFPRVKIYFSTFVVVCLSCLNSLFGSEYKTVFITSWMAFLVLFVVFNFKYVVNIYGVAVKNK
ncbi:oligosaccharide flippase family protein [Vibrio sp. S4M6]|uniref:lipopolysaccharide biosynthesis protein n=1 Tax=Vibrio sinus TaxID=2946865 RepID=UPI002029C7B6|nr:oligosaccharide flippase family protein [Vibrio sinus]MCL9781312.1 oligosaccharide flippase family protein [Vibrio sinus]